MKFDAESLKKENEIKRNMVNALEEMFAPILEDHAAGRCIMLSRKIIEKIQDMNEPEELLENEEKGKRVELLFEQLNALIDQFIKNEEKKND